MSKPGRPQAGPSDAGKPQIHDKAPPRWTGVPVERDPVSGRLLSGDPLGRADKGRSARGPGKTALITGAACVVVAAVVLTLLLVTGDDDPVPAASAGGVQTSEQSTTSAAPTTAEAVVTGPRDVTVVFTTTVVTPPPGFGPDPTQGSVGDLLTLGWTLTGPCDGVGACDIEQCDTGGCGPFSGEPQGTGYVARFSNPVSWDAPECPTGTVDNTVTWALTGEGDDVTVTGTWVQQAAQVLFTGTDGVDCGLYLKEWSIVSQ